MNETTICTRRAWIREKIRNLEELYEKIKLAWDLKGEQLVEMTQVLHHGDYNTTGLKDFGPDDENDKECDQVLKSFDQYIKLANETHVEEGNQIEIYKQELDDKLEWWRTQACDCILTEWGSWSECTKTCGEGENAGTTKRIREVSQEALNNGTCLGSREETKKCNNVCCPVDCTWNQWSEWTKCEEKCPVSEEEGKVHRYRSRNNEHECNGAPCQGNAEESKACNIINIMRDEIEGQQDKIDELIAGFGNHQDEISECRNNFIALKDFQQIEIHNGQIYLFHNQALLSHSSAREFCESKNLSLLTIHSANENQWIIETFVKAQTSDKGVWLDATLQEGGKWKWHNQSQEWTPHDPANAMFEDWHQGEPNNYNGHESCARINMDQHGMWKWNDVPCDIEAYTICTL